jgi:glycosyltransferase involved in cell wall biosynthesis
MPGISTIVISFNEEHGIERCLKSVAPFSDEIVVVDSGSTDDTRASASRYATRVIEQEWLGYGRQKQLALESVNGDWVFSIDADEEVSPELASEIKSLDYSVDGYEMPRRVWYLNRWINHSGWYPGYILRLFRRDKGSFSDDTIHEKVVVAGKVGRLQGDLYHYSYRDIGHHLRKLNDFTSLAASQMVRRGSKAGVCAIAFIPPLEFFKTYILRRGFLDGPAGLIVSVLHSYYVFLKYAKHYELKKLTGLDRKQGGADENHAPRASAGGGS